MRGTSSTGYFCRRGADISTITISFKLLTEVLGFPATQ